MVRMKERYCHSIAWVVMRVLVVISATETKIEKGVNASTNLPNLNNGLSWTFYREVCPSLESIVSKQLDYYMYKDVTQAAGLLRLHFHDCFVQGCDASLLLEGDSTSSGERSAVPNLTLRPEAFEIISDIKQYVESICPNTVSCADILALAARESIRKTGGPYYYIPLGRRDSYGFATVNTTIANIPAPTSSVTSLLRLFVVKGLNEIDLVALSGSHTIGRTHCQAFANRLSPKDPDLDNDLLLVLQKICPTANSTSTVDMDIRTPYKFDNAYYYNLASNVGLFNSDTSLNLDYRTRSIVQEYKADQSLFFWQFGNSMVKMSQIDVLTGTQGQIRRNCSFPNQIMGAVRT